MVNFYLNHSQNGLGRLPCVLGQFCNSLVQAVPPHGHLRDMRGRHEEVCRVLINHRGEGALLCLLRGQTG